MIEYDYTPGVLEYSKEMDESARQKYVAKVYRFLMGLPPGARRPIEQLCKAETRQLFIEVVKMYIDEGGWNKIEFSSDYLQLICLQPWTIHLKKPWTTSDC